MSQSLETSDIIVLQQLLITETRICISYGTSARYVAVINHEARGRADHEARGRAAPEGRLIYSGNVPNGRDMTFMCRHESAVMAKGRKLQAPKDRTLPLTFDL